MVRANGVACARNSGVRYRPGAAAAQGLLRGISGVAQNHRSWVVDAAGCSRLSVMKEVTRAMTVSGRSMSSM